MIKQRFKVPLLSLTLVLLNACSSFTGLRTPKYDGQPFVVQPEKIAAFEESREIIGEEKEHYLPEPFSEDILQPSLEAIEHEPVLLEEGIYTIGEELPPGRVSLIGQKEDPSMSYGGFTDPNTPQEPESYRVGTMTIRDSENALYFENMFHPSYGVIIAQVDFIEGHTIEIVGSNPEIVVFYGNALPDYPYVFDTREEEWLGEFEGTEEESSAFEGVPIHEYEQEQPLTLSEDGNTVELKAGIYEVGKHFEAGVYEITEQSAPVHTEIFLFSDSNEPRVFEVAENLYAPTHNIYAMINRGDTASKRPVIELNEGDKLYPHYVNSLMLTRIDE